MASIPREIIQKHNKLLVELCDYINIKDPAYTDFITTLRNADLPPGRLSRVENEPAKLFQLMQQKGKLKVGDYRVLEEALENSGNEEALAFVRKFGSEITQMIKGQGPTTSGPHGSTSTGSVMEEIPTEAKKKHYELYVILDGLITKDSFKTIKQMAQIYIDMKTCDKAKNMDELLFHLEEKGVIGVGKYDALVDMMTCGGIRIGVDEIQTTAKDIKDIMQKQSEISRLGAYFWNQDKIHPSPGTKRQKRRLIDDQDEPASKRIMLKEQRPHGSTSTGSVMEDIHTEAKKKHYELYVILDGLITKDSFKRIKLMALVYIDMKTCDKAKTMDQLLFHLEEKGVIGVGKYDALVEMMTDGGVRIGVDEIQKTAKDIKDIMQKQSEMSRLDAYFWNGDNIHPSPGKLHKTVLNRCLPVLVRDLDITVISDYMIQNDDVTMRDIMEQATTSDKIRKLIRWIGERDQDTYAKFKKCLVLANQTYLKDKLEEEEAAVAIEVKQKLEGDAYIPHIPEEIQSMSPEAVELYLKILETGVERRKDIRLMLVGLYNTGKTSLARRLMGQDVENIESTDGIQIFRGRCKISLDDGSWTTSESDLNEDAASRLVKLAVESMDKRILKSEDLLKEDAVPASIEDNSKVVGKADVGRNDSSKETPSAQLDQVMMPKMTSSLGDPSDIRNIKNMEKHLKNSTPERAVSKKDEALVNIWDFAGQFAYYSTHQLFLSPRAIYIVVFKLTEDMTKGLITNDVWFMDARGRKDIHIHAGCMFWLKSICHYGQSRSMQRNVILVGTHKDLIKGSEHEKEQHIEETFESIHKMLTDSEVAEIIHEERFAVNNLVEDQRIQKLRQTILDVAKSQDYWDEVLPAKWIQLEGRLIDERAKKKYMLSFQEMLEIDKSCSSPMGDENQLKLFLIYETQIGNLIFINEYPLQDTIVLDPQWIADAFCSAVADTQFARKFGSLRDAWTKMTQTAIMEESLLAKLWSEKNQHDFVVHEKKLLQYMVKLNMMAKIKVISDDGLKEEELPQYFIPCLLKECPDQSIGSCPNEECYARTAILCFEFSHQFLPPPVFHRLLSACIAKWSVARQGGKFLLFCGYGVFEIPAGCRLTIQHLNDIIAVRIFSVSKGTRMLDAKLCDKVRRFIRVALNQEFQRFRMVCQGEEPFKQKILCPVIEDINVSSDHRCELISVEDVVKNHVGELYSCAEHSDMSNPHDVKIKDILQHWFPDELASAGSANEQGQHWCLEDRIVTEKELSSISNLIGNGWEFLGRALEISDTKLEQIKEDYQKTRERIYQMLKTWKELSSRRATISEFMSAIQDSHIVVDKDNIKNIFDGTLASIGSISGPETYTPCKEPARTMTSSSCQPAISKVKVEKLQNSLDDTSAADDKVIQITRPLFCPYDTLSGNMKAQIDETDAVWNQTLRVQLAKSVGIIKSPYGSFGTGFRVGSDCIMTARHVIEYVLNAVPSQSSSVRIHHLSNAYIDFSYEVQGAPDAGNLRFFFKPEIIYANADMDTVILRLQSSTQTYPPPLTFAELSEPCGQLYFIGHSRVDIKKTDKFRFVRLINDDKIAAEKWSVKHVGVNGYKNIDNPHRLLFHCTFEQGASGSPGVWIYLENLQPCAKVVTMLLCGYPYWYYESSCPQKKKDETPKDHCVEQGVCIRSLSEDMKNKKPDLWKEIFFETSNDNDDVEMKCM